MSTKKTANIFRENLTQYIIKYINEDSETFGIGSVLDVVVSNDYSYADFYVTSSKNEDKLPKYLSKFSNELRRIIGKDFGAKKSPIIRFKLQKNNTNDIISLINKLSKENGIN